MPINDRLFRLLRQLDDQELFELWVEALCLDVADYDFALASRAQRIFLISEKWRSVHRLRLPLLPRDPHALTWKCILIDVVNQLERAWPWNRGKKLEGMTELDLERAILWILDEVTDKFMRKGITADQAADPVAMAHLSESALLRAAKSKSTHATVMLLTRIEWHRFALPPGFVALRSRALGSAS